MKRPFVEAAALVLLASLLGCGTGNSTNNPGTGAPAMKVDLFGDAPVRAVNLDPNFGTLSIYVDGEKVVEDLPTGGVSEYFTLSPLFSTVAVEMKTDHGTFITEQAPRAFDASKHNSMVFAVSSTPTSTYYVPMEEAAPAPDGDFVALAGYNAIGNVLEYIQLDVISEEDGTAYDNVVGDISTGVRSFSDGFVAPGTYTVVARHGRSVIATLPGVELESGKAYSVFVDIVNGAPGTPGILVVENES